LDNHYAGHLAWIASSRAPTPPDAIIEKFSMPLIKLAEPADEAIKQDLTVIDEPEQEPTYDWMHPIKSFLEN
jgi:hypothetical protein